MSVRWRISDTTWPNFTKFCVHCLRSWLSPQLSTLKYLVYFQFDSEMVPHRRLRTTPPRPHAIGPCRCRTTGQRAGELANSDRRPLRASPVGTFSKSAIFCHDVMFSHDGALHIYSSSAAVVIDERPVTPAWSLSTRPQLAANDLIAWRGGRRYYGAGAKSVLVCIIVSHSVSRSSLLFLSSP